MKEMPLLGTPLEEYVGRNIGINLESTDGLHLSRSTPVTVFPRRNDRSSFLLWCP